MINVTDTHTTIERDGVTIAYTECGDPDGQPVVLVHGLFSSGRSWDDFAPLLPGNRVIVMDLRGHGNSSKAASYTFEDFAADLTCLLDELDLHNVDLVGHSLGGHIVSIVAEQQPDRVRRLVIEDAPPPPVAGDSYRGPGLSALPGRSRALLIGALIFRYRKVRQYVDIPMARAVLREFRRKDQGWWDALKSITAPTLMLWGGSTSHVPGHRLEEMVKLIPDAELFTIPVGHRVHHNDLEQFAGLVVEFLHK